MFIMQADQRTVGDLQGQNPMMHFSSAFQIRDKAQSPGQNRTLSRHGMQPHSSRPSRFLCCSRRRS